MKKEYKVVKDYENAIFELVKTFTILYNLEDDEEYEYDPMDYWLIWNSEIGFGPVEINDRYFNLDDLYITLWHSIPFAVLDEYYDKSLESHERNEQLWYNLINYYKRFYKSKEQRDKEKAEDLERSEQAVKYAKTEFEKRFNTYKNK